MQRKSGTTEIQRIADAICKLVERVDGAVTLVEVDRQVRGFAAAQPPSWSIVEKHDAGETILWSGMTEAGLGANRLQTTDSRVLPLCARERRIEPRPLAVLCINSGVDDRLTASIC
jgi:hypothetical protein